MEISNGVKKPLTIFLIFLVVIFLFLLGQYFYFYPGRYQPPSPERPGLEEIGLPITEIKTFSDVYQKQKGRVLLDLAHENDFQPEELSLLIFRITSRGYDFEYLKEKNDLENMLRSSYALMVILPQEEFNKEEIKLIKEFRERGGKILLIGDPTRPSKINSLSTDFGLIFESDYLYNQKENEGNFRYIYITNFKSDLDLTKNLERIVLYSASSISSPGWGIGLADENTFSSITQAERRVEMKANSGKRQTSSTSEIKDRLSPIVLNPEGRVLAISDLTFMVEPYNASQDNNQFITNLADWLTRPERTFYLSDFPYFFEEEVQVVYAGTDYLDSSLKLKNFLKDLEKRPELTQYKKNISKDFAFLGLFDDGEKIEDFLKKGDITITDKKIKIIGVGEINHKGASIFYLDKNKITGSDVLIILSDTKEGLGEATDKLINGQFRDWLVTDTLAIYQKEVKEEEE